VQGLVQGGHAGPLLPV